MLQAMERVMQHLGREHRPLGIQVPVQQHQCHLDYNRLAHLMEQRECQVAELVPYLVKIMHRKKVR